MMVHTCNPSYLGGGGKREQPRRKLKTLWKTKAQRAGGMAQVVEHLPSKYETLSSKSSTPHTHKFKCFVSFTSTS
jgi:hypothetical protein